MENKYFNFPVVLLKDAFLDIRKVMNDIFDYAGYAHTLKLEFGDSIEKIEDAGKYLGIRWGNTNLSYKNGKKLYDSIKNSPMVGINKAVCFDFYNNPKTQDEIAVLLAFLAIKSIVGLKPYCKMTNNYLLARMGGYARINELLEQFPKPLDKYTTRRKLDKIKFELQANWNVNIYSRYTRGFYVSIDKTFTLDNLVFEAEKRRKSTREKQIKQMKDEAREKALQKLNIESLKK